LNTGGLFQSSADPKIGSNGREGVLAIGVVQVSILTRSEDRLQRPIL
jgi:hypothetical protein